MRRVVVFVLAVLVVLSLAAPAQAAIKWDYPSMSVVHASDGMGLTNGSLSVHRTSSTLHGMYAGYSIYGTPRTWTRPALSGFLKDGWTYDSIVGCAQCHSYISATSSVPAAGYPGSYATLTLDPSADDGMSSTTGEAVICEKCHDLLAGTTWGNSVHGGRGHSTRNNLLCVECHVRLPHGSGLPRLLGYEINPSPYDTVDGGLAGFKLKDYTPVSWKKADCSSSCHTSAVGEGWPSGGSVGGVVRDGAGVPIAGATVAVVGVSATTDVAGAYRIDNLGAGYASVVVSASGYSTVRRYVTITAGALLPLDVNLAAIP